MSHVLNGPDYCGTCSGNNACADECGIPNGDNSLCADCNGIPNGGSFLNDCEECVDEGTNTDEDEDGIDDCYLEGNAFPQYFSLSQNYPNPFNPTTSIDFTIPNGDYLSMNILDIKGQIIQKVIENKFYSSGIYTQVLDGSSFNSGIYFVQLISSENILNRKIVLIK